MNALAVAQLLADLRSGRARTIREKAGLSQADVSRAVGAHPTTVCGWESGRRKPRGTTAARYAELLWELEKLTREAS